MSELSASAEAGKSTQSCADLGDLDGNSPQPTPGAAHQHDTGERRGYAVLRSYVKPGRPDDDGGHSLRNYCGRKGVERVLRFEVQQGRHPKAMPPRHEGYDIESHDDDGNIGRIIEVKSLDGDWTQAGVGLTKPQLEKARLLRHQYWLYVVEHVLDDERFRIHAIQDPYGQASRFMFTPEWRHVEECHGSALVI